MSVSVRSKSVSLSAPICILFRTNAVSLSDSRSVNQHTAAFFTNTGRASRTVKHYQACLDYWDAWYRRRYAVGELPLLRSPPEPLSRETLEQFISDHLAQNAHGQVAMRMPVEVSHYLKSMGLNKNISCPAPLTVIWRLKVVRLAHRLFDLPYDPKLFAKAAQKVTSAWKAAHVTVLGPERSYRPIDDVARALCEACPNTWEGLRDAAMVVLLRRFTPLQVAALCIKDVEQPQGTERTTTAFHISILNPMCDAQRFSSGVCITGWEAVVLEKWLTLRCELANDVDLLLIRAKKRRNTTPRLPAYWFSERLRQITDRAGLGGELGCSATQLRKATERASLDSLLMVQIARHMGMKATSIKKIVYSED